MDLGRYRERGGRESAMLGDGANFFLDVDLGLQILEECTSESEDQPLCGLGGSSLSKPMALRGRRRARVLW